MGCERLTGRQPRTRSERLRPRQTSRCELSQANERATADASLEVVIPQRFGRPAGYAFVALKTEEDSKKVLEALADEGEWPF